MKYSDMRNELISYLWGLSHLDYQKSCWVNGKCPDNIEYDELDYTIHFFFDDTELSSNTKSLLGSLLKDEKELILIEQLCKEIESIFHKYGTNLSDEEYINLPEWNSVIEAAGKAYIVISKK